MKRGLDYTAIAGRMLLGAAAGGALYFAAMSLSGTKLPGCAAGSTCQEVLQSEWAFTFGVPVSFFGSVLYSLTVLLSWAFVRRERTIESLQGGMALSTVLAAAVWFTALQIFALETLCWWCCAIHGCAVAGGFLLWRSRLRHPIPHLDCTNDLRDASSPLSNDRVYRFTATGSALTAVGMLALGSMSGPLRPRRSVGETRAAAPAAAVPSPATLAAERVDMSH